MTQRSWKKLSWWLGAVLVVTGGAARADEPKFSFEKPVEVKAPAWKAQAKLGLLSTTGNAQSLSLGAGATVTYESNQNKLLLGGGLAYVRTWVTVADDANGSGALDEGEINRIPQDTSKAWNLQARYDRFFATLNSVYLTGHVQSDPPAGKQFLGGGQGGYTRLLLKNDHHQTSVEVGVDYTHEVYVATGSVTPPVDAVSARLFVNHAVKFNSAAGASVSLEALDNFVPEANASNPFNGGALGVGAFQDLRVNGVASVSAAISSHVSLALSFTVKYDRVPAPFPPVTIPKPIPFAADYKPFAQNVDTLLDASLLVNFL